ncbi:hypothetical protein F6R98_17075 [Candidatus Methylospira mobilis]|uniref:DUF2335 domain-containing protein n=2 Tax=Candidatus Methylospira mobilis TaxID=1808979 RepID=A0A5Q0BJZ7_9GAMM|nr:hypothetical protein [Candidatus Methylospira mobilis]QFY44133.1 hypothetical protein F6R98_17075 [Candidatus Methylospira mobilis]WNV06451.1 hypothetical protein RP726_08605 [Candidatus Methylospira mobilis]
MRERGKELTVQQHETDSPVLPIAQIEKLHAFRPDLVDWVFNQTQAEAEHRRDEQRRINKFVFIERLVGQACALLIGLAGIGGGVYAAINGHEWAGGTIASLAITGLAVVFLTGKQVKS